jgi:hypothetical protein
MSSDESNLSSAPPARPPEGKPRSSAGMVALSVILLGGLVWAIAPGRARFTPAPLRPVTTGCPHTAPDFTPSDITEISGVDLSSFSTEHRNHLLYRLNMEPCPCKCNVSVAICRMGHPNCPLCGELVKKMVEDERAAPETQK